ncbi:MAG: tetratricopeptide repeat protein [Ruminiclostridium sp.]|nr:tetratricopeptide repeat protein [Ruminiclostridium sp.]
MCNLILIVVLVLVVLPAREVAAKSALVTILILFSVVCFLTPALVRIFMYQHYRQPQGFSASYAIHEYHLEGWLKGKYLFFDAIFNRVNGDFDEAIRYYEKCLSEATDPRMRRACYVDMARYLNNYIVLMPHFIRASKEFPNETIFINVVSSYYLYCPSADRDEGERWFESIMALEGEEFKPCREMAYYRLGLIRMYEKRYGEAIELFSRVNTLRKNGINHSLLINLALCRACVGDFDRAREAAVHALVMVDNEVQFDDIREIIEYMFRANTDEINPEIEKLAEELARREEARETVPLTAYERPSAS